MTDGTKKGLHLGFAELAVMALDLGCLSHVSQKKKVVYHILLSFFWTTMSMLRGVVKFLYAN